MEIKRDCILYRDDRTCAGLEYIYCKEEKCNFYKSKKEYNKDGTKINNISYQKKVKIEKV